MMNEGKVIQVIGPVVDVEFAEGELPAIFTALHITNPTIDDTEDNLDLLEDVLGQCSVRTIRATSGHKALSIAERELLNLIILDVNMPEMDGFEVARRMRTLKPCATIPIIFLTAYRTTDNDLITGLGAGANDYVTKPFDKSDLLSRVETMLRRGDAAHR